MTTWAKVPAELVQLITPDGVTYDLTTESGKGKWVLQHSGWGLPAIDYFSDKSPFQHGVNVRDYRLKSRVVQLMLRIQGCNRDEYWSNRTDLLDAIRPNRDPIDLTGALILRSQAPAPESDTFIYSLVVFNNRLYGGSFNNGLLLQWDGSNRWIEVAPQYTVVQEDSIRSLIVYDDGGGTDELYGGGGSNGQLLKWDGSAWTLAAGQLNAQAEIHDMVVFDDGLGGGDQIFAGTGNGGRLFHFNVGGAAWAQDCAQLGAETDIRSLAIFDDGGGDDLYGGTRPNGLLYRYNPAGPAWVAVCAQLNGQTDIYDLVVFNGRLYGSTGAGGRLFRLNAAGNAWEQVAPQHDAEAQVYGLIVYQGQLFGCTGPNGRLLRWNNVDAWELVASTFTTLFWTMEVFNNRLFLGSATNAYLHEYIRRSGETDLPCSTLRRVLSDGSIRDLCVHIQEGPEFTSDQENWDEFNIQEMLRFWAPDPIAYDPDEQDGPTYTMDPLATGSVNEEQDVTYEGTWEEHPTFVLTGPINNPIIRNEDTDEFIELDYNIPAGRVVTITLTPGNQTVEDDLGTNLIGVVTPESNLQSFHLAPDPEVTDGDNTISIQGTGTTAATDFTYTYYNRYIGI